MLDGWWCEGYNGRNGWAIGGESDDPDNDRQDELDARSLYDTLENEIIPLYYGDRGSDDLPHGWIERIKESMRTLAPQFSTRRMLTEYMTQAYRPEMQAYDMLAKNAKPAKKK